jgi:two-component system, LytTR family, response regulator
MSLTCIAIDDEPRALTVIRHYAQKIPFLELVGEFRSGLDALVYLAEHPVDLIFLDINMPDLTGLEFLQSLPQPPMVIFSTAYSEYAVQSYEWEAVDYLVKPVEFGRFLKAVNRAAAQLSLKQKMAAPKGAGEPAREDFILVKSGPQTFHVRLADIRYLEASGNHVLVVTQEKKMITQCPLGELLQVLPPEQFYRVHKSFIISLKHLEVIERHQVQVAGTLIPLGRLFREAFLRAYKK